jgi:hypothetical protein
MAYTTIDDPSAHFQVKTYSGNSTQTAITYDGNSNLQPDWIWAKSRSNAHYHDWRDTSRGLTKRLTSNENNAEDTKSASYVSFDSNGFTLGDDQSGGSNANTVNSSSNNYVSWGWKANGGTTSSNGNGSVTSTVQANTTAGFSIVTYTGTGSGNTIGHGLGVTPDWITVKVRSTTNNWGVWHQDLGGANKYLKLNTDDSTITATDVWNNTLPTSTVFSTGAAGTSNDSGETYVAYCFTSIKGYSKFGNYTGNGNADGPFVYTGFKPAWLMWKRTDSGTDWRIFDNKRDDDNVVKGRLFPNDNAAENTSQDTLDFLSNGFKLRSTNSGGNASSGTYVYMAFAEHPFVSSKGVPVTAR